MNKLAHLPHGDLSIHNVFCCLCKNYIDTNEVTSLPKAFVDYSILEELQRIGTNLIIIISKYIQFH